MQYLLTEEEYIKLKQAAEDAKKAEVVTINRLCQMVADNLPIKDWPGTETEPKPWKCINSVDYEWYCDNCPVVAVCRAPHHYSK